MVLVRRINFQILGMERVIDSFDYSSNFSGFTLQKSEMSIGIDDPNHSYFQGDLHSQVNSV